MKRPTKFSDPHREWDGCENLLRRILDADPYELTVEDYRVIFARTLPAADYEEGVYYLRHCFDNLTRADVDDETRYPDSVLWWVQKFEHRLRSDGLLDGVLSDVRLSLERILSRFEMFSLTKQECRAKGRDFLYSVGPYNQRTATDLLDDLTSWPLYNGLTDSVLAWLADFSHEPRARWYVELTFHTRIWLVFHPDKNHRIRDQRKQQVFDWFHEASRLGPATEIARKAALREGHDKYVEHLDTRWC